MLQNEQTLMAFQTGITAYLISKLIPGNQKMILHYISNDCRVIFRKLQMHHDSNSSQWNPMIKN